MVFDVLHQIEIEPGYKEISIRSDEEANNPNPIRRGLFGSSRYLAINSKSYPGRIARQLLNSNFQMTSAEILCISILCLIHDLANNRIPGISWGNFKPLLPIHDEMVSMCHDSVINEAEKILKYYMLPKVDGWGSNDTGGQMVGVVGYGQHYIHK